MKFQFNRFSALSFTKQALNRSNVFSMFIILSCLLFSLATYAVGIPDPSLVGYWTFDVGTGTQVEDLTTNNNTGNLLNTPQFTQVLPV